MKNMNVELKKINGVYLPILTLSLSCYIIILITLCSCDQIKSDKKIDCPVIFSHFPCIVISVFSVI
jgi:hypothetical protein